MTRLIISQARLIGCYCSVRVQSKMSTPKISKHQCVSKW